jgi:hypothetical protein
MGLCCYNRQYNEETTMTMEDAADADVLIEELLNQSTEDESSGTHDIWNGNINQDVQIVSKKETSKFPQFQNIPQEHLHQESDIVGLCPQTNIDANEFESTMNEYESYVTMLKTPVPTNNHEPLSDLTSGLDEPSTVQCSPETSYNEESLLEEISTEIEFLSAQRNHQSKWLIFVCPFCGSEMKTSIELTNHVLALHSFC